jgi:phosphomannomutase
VAGRKVVSVNKADGVKFLLDDNSWLLLRASGTEPLLRVMVEARDEVSAERFARRLAETMAA